MQQIPNKIYKYVDLETLEIILKNQTLKFSNPLDFNDPFDCDIDLVFFDFNGEIDKSVIEEIEIIKNRFKNNPNATANLNNNSFLQEMYRFGQLAKIKSSRITCFSIRNDIVLMWSHYADKHCGACLEFDNLKDNKFIDLKESKYTRGLVEYEAHNRINYISTNREYAIKKVFLNKSKSWSHEQEYRMVTIANKHEFQKFKPDFITAIYFGVKVREEKIKSFMEKLDIPEFNHLKYYKGIKSNLSIKFKQII